MVLRITDLAGHEQIAQFGMRDIRLGTVPDDFAQPQDDRTLSNFHRLARVLLDQQDRAAVGVESFELGQKK
jgi:hypothetical protein